METDLASDDPVPPYTDNPTPAEELSNDPSKSIVNVDVHEEFNSEKYENIKTEDQNTDTLTKKEEESFRICIEENPKDTAGNLEKEQASSSKESASESNITLPESFTDPKDVLINFLYTSHIDITQKNVSALKELALQCDMSDVITACEEFTKVLQMETEHLSNEKEKLEVELKFRYRYSDPSMAEKMLQHFEKLRRETNLTDVKLRSFSGKVTLDAHFLLLTCCSPFFLPLTSSHKTGDELDITEVEEDILEPLVGFLYTGKIGVTQQSVSKLIRAADRMQLSDIVEGCAEFMESTTTIHNCIQHRSIAIDYKCDKLKVTIMCYA